jgi:hypothetical protein
MKWTPAHKAERIGQIERSSRHGDDEPLSKKWTEQLFVEEMDRATQTVDARGFG